MASSRGMSSPVFIPESTDNLTLKDILLSFNAPINEEQAWAVCFQTAVFLQNAIKDGKHERSPNADLLLLNRDGSVDKKVTTADEEFRSTVTECDIVESLGLVIYTALDHGLAEDEEQNLSQSLENLISRMTGSCHSNHENEEEEDDDNNHSSDEGLGTDPDDDLQLVSLQDVIQCCADHLPSSYDACSHYRAVCHALVTEAFQLRDFLDRISTVQAIDLKIQKDSNFNHTALELCRADWARLWIQVIQDLRKGIKLKQVKDIYLPPIEYELTPYEILMEDIRMRRYNLKQVIGDIKRKDDHLNPHDIILNFIRSRPPLQPAGERQLGPIPPKEPILHELLLEGIKHPPRLRPTPRAHTYKEERKMTNEEEGKKDTPKRRLIKANFTFLDNDFLTSSDEEDCKEDGKSCQTSSSSQKKIGGVTPLQKAVAMDIATQKPRHKPERRHSITLCQSTSRQQVDEPPVCRPVHVQPMPSLHVPQGCLRPRSLAVPDHAYSEMNSVVSQHCQGHDLELYGHDLELYGDGDLHNQNAACNVDVEQTKGSKDILNINPTNSRFGYSSNPQQLPLLCFNNIANDSAKCDSFTQSLHIYNQVLAAELCDKVTLKPQVDTSQYDFDGGLEVSEQFDIEGCNSEEESKMNWCNPLDSLSLTLQEVGHIRAVLSKAELESLINNPRLYDQVSRGKVCFTCKQTRFSLFGSWATKCKLCHRKVCSKCTKKIRIPMDHFKNIPVYTLSPTGLTPKNLTEDMGVIESTGSSPPSPILERNEEKHNSNQFVNGTSGNGHPSIPSNVKSSPSASKILKTNDSKRWASLLDPQRNSRKKTLQGPLANLCRNCKDMVCNVIRSSRMSLTMSSANLFEITLPTMPSSEDSKSDVHHGSTEKKRRKAGRHCSLNIRPSYL